MVTKPPNKIKISPCTRNIMCARSIARNVTPNYSRYVRCGTRPIFGTNQHPCERCTVAGRSRGPTRVAAARPDGVTSRPARRHRPRVRARRYRPRPAQPAQGEASRGGRLHLELGGATELVLAADRLARGPRRRPRRVLPDWSVRADRQIPGAYAGFL